jgi:hypothetical protein
MHGIVFKGTLPLDTYEMYDRVTEEIYKHAGPDHPLWQECLLHMCQPTDEGFTVTEVWTTEARAQEFWDKYLRPALEATGHDAEQIGRDAVHFEPYSFEVRERKIQDP